jgi:Flp pilus assembly protein TadD
VYATTLAAGGRYDEAVATAEEALRLAEGEDTLAGLAKVLALKGDHAKAKELYARSLEKAGPSRRPVRRAALGFLQWIDGETDAARATVAPCLPGGADATARERGACLWAAALIEPAHAEDIAAQLDALDAQATDLVPAYGSPAALARLIRVRAHGGCLPASGPVDFYATYHVPLFAKWAACTL